MSENPPRDFNLLSLDELEKINPADLSDEQLKIVTEIITERSKKVTTSKKTPAEDTVVKPKRTIRTESDPDTLYAMQLDKENDFGFYQSLNEEERAHINTKLTGKTSYLIEKEIEEGNNKGIIVEEPKETLQLSDGAFLAEGTEIETADGYFTITEIKDGVIKGKGKNGISAKISQKTFEKRIADGTYKIKNVEIETADEPENLVNMLPAEPSKEQILENINAEIKLKEEKVENRKKEIELIRARLAEIEASKVKPEEENGAVEETTENIVNTEEPEQQEIPAEEKVFVEIKKEHEELEAKIQETWEKSRSADGDYNKEQEERDTLYEAQKVLREKYMKLLHAFHEKNKTLTYDLYKDICEENKNIINSIGYTVRANPNDWQGGWGYWDIEDYRTEVHFDETGYMRMENKDHTYKVIAPDGSVVEDNMSEDDARKLYYQKSDDRMDEYRKRRDEHGEERSVSRWRKFLSSINIFKK